MTELAATLQYRAPAVGAVAEHPDAAVAHPYLDYETFLARLV